MLSLSPRHATLLPRLSIVAEEGIPYEVAIDDASPPSGPPVELDAFELHYRIVGLQRLSDRTRLELLRVLAVLDDGRRYLELGYSSTKHYLLQALNVGRTNAHELVRVARRLGELPRLAAALEGGDIRWSTLLVVSRVATEETEAEWLEHATTHTFEQTLHEVKRAICERRDRPADASEHGLSNVMTRISFELSLEEKERFTTAMARVTEEMGDGAPTDLASVLTFVSQRILEGQPVVAGATVHNVDAGPDETAGPARPTRAPGLTVVYHQYADRATTVDTPDGPVSVAPEVADRIADVAQAVTLTAADVAESEPLRDGAVDRPNSSALARKVRKRDGERCANPGCGTRKGLQAHHIHYRASGGRSELGNEVALCRTCHTLVHAGLVEIERGATGELRWAPRVRTASVERSMDGFPRLDELMADVAMPAPPDPVAALDIEALVDGLTSLGIAEGAARRRLDAALTQLGAQARTAGLDGAIDEPMVLREALRMGTLS